jgi:hypothetical protein
VSCASAGNCAAGGYYTDSSGNLQAFVADEADSVWGDATEVPGTATLNTGNAQVTSVSCPSAGNCTIGGYYTDSSASEQAFVADEVDGSWGDATDLSGATGNAAVYSVSCASAGNCAAGGSYTDSSGNMQAFVADEADGFWGDATEVPGIAALNTLGIASVGSLSCPSAGNCTAGGAFTDSSGGQAFVVDEVGSTWGQAVEVPGTAALNTGFAAVNSVSCSSAGNCSAGGYYDVSFSGAPTHLFVVSEVSGAWGDAVEVPGIPFPSGENAALDSVSCASAGNCVAGGSYIASSGDSVAFVVSEVNGLWGEAVPVPGIPALNAIQAGVYSVSCPPTGACVAAGSYEDTSFGDQPFVVSQT